VTLTASIWQLVCHAKAKTYNVQNLKTSFSHSIHMKEDLG